MGPEPRKPSSLWDYFVPQSVSLHQFHPLRTTVWHSTSFKISYISMCLSIYLNTQKAHKKQYLVPPDTLVLLLLSYPIPSPPFFPHQPLGKLIFVGVLFKGISQSFKVTISLQTSQKSFPKEVLLYLFLNTAANSKVLLGQTVIKPKTQLPDYHFSVELKHTIYWHTSSPRF